MKIDYKKYQAQKKKLYIILYTNTTALLGFFVKIAVEKNE